MAIAFRANATGGANNTSATITVPATCQVGDVLFVHLSLNNTDALASTPAPLSLLSTNITTAPSFPNRLYWGAVDGVTLSASTVLTWALSATRSWTLNLYAVSGAHSTQPLQAIWTNGSAAGTTMVLPSTATAADGWLVELGSGKSNGTSVTSWTPPAGWTIRSTATANVTTFQGSSFFADYDSNIAVAGSYGGDSYTPNNAISGTLSYLLTLNPATMPGPWLRA
jgi:hypothetical protein